MAISKEGYALLETISGPESRGAYNVIYGGRRFSDFSDHPRQYVTITSGPNKGRKSSAAGKYQFLGSTWDAAKSALGLTDFSPASQDAAAWWLAQRDYKDDTGRDLQADLSEGDNSRMNSIAKSLSGTWTSLPSGIEQGIAGSAFVREYYNKIAAPNLQSEGRQNSALSAIDHVFRGDLSENNPSNRLSFSAPGPQTRTPPSIQGFATGNQLPRPSVQNQIDQGIAGQREAMPSFGPQVSASDMTRGNTPLPFSGDYGPQLPQAPAPFDQAEFDRLIQLSRDSNYLNPGGSLEATFPGRPTGSLPGQQAPQPRPASDRPTSYIPGSAPPMPEPPLDRGMGSTFPGRQEFPGQLPAAQQVPFSGDYGPQLQAPQPFNQRVQSPDPTTMAGNVALPPGVTPNLPELPPGAIDMELANLTVPPMPPLPPNFPMRPELSTGMGGFGPGDMVGGMDVRAPAIMPIGATLPPIPMPPINRAPTPAPRPTSRPAYPQAQQAPRQVQSAGYQYTQKPGGGYQRGATVGGLTPAQAYAKANADARARALANSKYG